MLKQCGIYYFHMYLLVVEKKLLDRTLIPHKLEIVASSWLGAENSPAECILQFTGPSKYWKPAAHDVNGCYIDINLGANHNITAVELRGMYCRKTLTSFLFIFVSKYL